ncbi:quinone oxidoreductase family protein [Glaciimonas immobilis]|uniref:NADPH2:quinone reductase n=1 Tax=Glaciimonas immobilis TaxID=728004 RepID=A0A840RZ89_9BURK|nr:quinone oxidoreductase [Glaciimonas immobilis]KAF3996056.1 quinone oxidoreductase [Glaciimonas immobilis]MBB5201811.1 NADPH2:quinone reductase [Glaciimonas immobilis]
MAQQIVIKQYGGPEVLTLQDVDVGHPGPGEAKLLHTKIGVNFHDVYVRSGLYKTLTLPGTPGIEAAGVVMELGKGVNNVNIGDRVAYITGAYGVYASERLIDANLLISLPDTLTDTVAASALLRGLTVEMLLNRVHQVRAGMTILVQAAAGGVGQMLCQWATKKGAVVIGTAGSEEQVRLAQAAGCCHVIRYLAEDVANSVRAYTDGRGVDVAYDGVGKETFAGSLSSLAFCGHLVNFGQASGAVPPFEVSQLAAKSNSLSRPIVFHYTRENHVRAQMAQNVIGALTEGWLKVNPAIEFPLFNAADCHRLLEAKGASRPLLLVP